MRDKKIIICIAAAIVLKSFLFLYSVTQVPDLKFRNDTHGYLESGLSLVSHGAFGTINDDGSIAHQYYRTPGYPLFLGIVHGILKIPLNGVVLLQILLTIASAVIVFKTAIRINPKLGMLSFFIILFDPAITLYSLMLLTETLFLFFICVFMYTMITYLQKQEIKHLLLSALVLAAATYIRPISFYLGGVLALFILFVTLPKNLKKRFLHACLFAVTVYSLLFLWQWRNHHHFHEYRFSNISNATVNLKGLYKSYDRNDDPYSQGLSPLPYYMNVASRNLMSLMTRPVSFKYFNSDILKKAGKIFAYPFIAFWLVGLLMGISQAGKNIPFHFLLIVILYFIGTTIVGAMWGADARFRIPMMPFIALLSAHGWIWLKEKSQFRQRCRN